MARIQPDEVLTIGDVAKRSGATVPTLRYYEQRGLIDSSRTAGNQRVYARHTLRRLAVIAAGKRVGLTLEQISDALSTLPRDRAPTQRDWTRMSRSWADLVARRIRVLQQLAVDLDGCIGCGCLSLGRCTLFNPIDEAAAEGPGSRWLRNAETATAGLRRASVESGAPATSPGGRTVVEWMRAQDGGMNERMLPDRDVAALIGVIALLEGVIQAGEAESGIADRLRRRLQSDEYLPLGTSRGFNDEDVRQKLNDLNQRLRFVLREHDDPSASYPVWAPDVES